MDDSVSEDVMRATHRALCAHGYADLTMQDIADESDRSKAALHYHYDTKRDLMVAFLEHLGDELQRRLDGLDGETPLERLVALVDELISSTSATPEHDTALLEIKAQAPYDEAFRERIERIHQLIRDRVRDLVREGVETGTFREDVDPDRTATFVVTVLTGARTRRVAVGDSPDAVREALLAYVEERLVADGEVPRT